MDSQDPVQVAEPHPGVLLITLNRPHVRNAILITAADTAFFALPEVACGLIAAEGGAIRLPRRIPYHVAMEMLLTAAPLPAPDAAGYGLVNQLAPEGQALDAALALAHRVQAHSREAVHVTK
ncbi:enoyl-CoA hydratase-related protein [Streptomyces sp. NPDC098789]|uniref:enoyl-CoA hydratase-related protein n=1 Tax=Streptomyces sp. NPDC098789 TaxID=3366098 RepID=UPI00380351CE